MQVVSLVSRDGFLAAYNVSIPTDDFIEVLQSFPKPYQLHMFDEITGIYGKWAHRYAAKYFVVSLEFADFYEIFSFTEILCPTGFCVTFNFPNTSQFFNTERSIKFIHGP